MHYTLYKIQRGCGALQYSTTQYTHNTPNNITMHYTPHTTHQTPNTKHYTLCTQQRYVALSALAVNGQGSPYMSYMQIQIHKYKIQIHYPEKRVWCTIWSASEWAGQPIHVINANTNTKYKYTTQRRQPIHVINANTNTQIQNTNTLPREGSPYMS